MEVRTMDAESGLHIPARFDSFPGSPKPETQSLPGRSILRLPVGRSGVVINAPGYRTGSIWIDLNEAESPPLVLRLAPEHPRAELQPEVILSKTRPDSTLFVGFVGDEESGLPLGQVRVRSMPSGVETLATEAGYFELHVPCPTGNGSPAQLSFEKPGFQSEVRTHLDLSRGGDWTYRVLLSRGRGSRVIDERQTRRWSVAPAPVPPPGASPAGPIEPDPAIAAPGFMDFIPSVTSPSNLTIRVPRMIRILYTNVVFYETLENYCRHVLPSEWISSWGSYTGGSNSLQAGAVALRTYAIGYVNSPLAANYDICATTSCQVYNPAVTSSRTDLAVTQTASYVMVNSSVSIPRGLTEYSAENNQLGMTCGDGFTAPTGGCLADPVCAGEAEFGHGRGMCQWGTVKWATGLKFPGNSFSNTTATNGQPRRDWRWLAQHYYPNLTLVRGAALLVGDDVRATTASLNVRNCPGDSITNGANCPSVATVPLGTAGVILAGPEQVLADDAGYVWWYVQWTTGATGWVVENYLSRIITVPPAPLGLSAAPLSSTSIQLGWNDPSEYETGFKIERALSPGGPWAEVDRIEMNVTALVVSNLSAQTIYYFRIRAFNLGGDSGYSGVASATTSGTGLALEPIPNLSVNEQQPVHLVAKVLNGDTVQSLVDFEQFTSPPPNGSVLFRVPGFSGSTSGFLDSSPNVSSVTGAVPPGPTGARALAVSCSFSNASTGWLRLTTAGAATLPNPVIDFTKGLRLDIYSDRAVRIGLGMRETTNAAGTVLGSDGGTAGAIEWVGVTGRISGQPQPARLVSPGAWQTLTFDLAKEPVTSFVSGNNILATASGLGVFEHLVVVPMDGAGTYNLFVDNIAMVQRRVFLFSLEPGAPAGAVIGSSSGEFSWTPTEAQGPATHVVGVRVTDNPPSGQSDVKTFQATVREVNQAPLFPPVGSRWVHAGTTLVVTNSATDLDLPANALTFDEAMPLPSGASVEPASGVLTWHVADSSIETTNVIAIRATDNGSPALSATNMFVVRTSPRPRVQPLVTAAGGIELRWTGIPGWRYQVQYSDEVDAATWVDVGEPVVSQTGEIVVEEPRVSGQRFFRLILLE